MDCRGEAPRYFGNSDPCTLIGPKVGIFKIDCGKIFPYEITTRKSGFLAFSQS
jgi:hypothetical protein